jgi:hypothetical protein
VRFPRKLAEVDQWLESQKAGPAWAPEKALSIEKTPRGSVEVRAGGRTLGDEEPILVLHRGAWVEGRLKLYGDGRKPLPTPLVKLRSTRRAVALTPRTRARVRGSA